MTAAILLVLKASIILSVLVQRGSRMRRNHVYQRESVCFEHGMCGGPVADCGDSGPGADPVTPSCVERRDRGLREARR
jgi:hypothetical protein